MKKICVIGSNAFSGQDFVDLLLDDPNREVIGISRSPEQPDYMLRYKSHPNLGGFRFQRFDLNGDADALAAFLDKEKPDTIVNHASQSEVGPSWDHPDHWYQTNCVAMTKLVNHLSKVDYLDKFLQISTPEVYGTTSGIVKEDAPANPSTPYASSRAATDQMIEVFRKQYGFPIISVRPTNYYGARQQLFKIICRTVIYAKLGKRIQLHGGGVAVKSYIHVRDVSRGVLEILKSSPLNEMYHLSPAQGIAVKDVVEKLCRRMGVNLSDAVDIAPERPGQDMAYVIDSTKARNAFGWTTEISFDEGVDEVVSWIEANWDEIKDTSLDYQHKA